MPLLSRTGAMSARGFGMFGSKPRLPYSASYLVIAGGGADGAGGSIGGSGIIILSVPTANYSGITTGSPTITTSGANTIIKFTGTGTYTA